MSQVEEEAARLGEELAQVLDLLVLLVQMYSIYLHY
jgi:NTP pyrophosphatase (non-canonical NTP hydrolase)